VKADLVHNLPLLRAELANLANPAFFFYDGSKLLFSLSKDKADQALVHGHSFRQVRHEEIF